MNPGVRMLMLTRKDRERYRDWDREYVPKDEWGAWIEGRFRDRDGREHYDNGRYAPQSMTEPYGRTYFDENQHWPTTYSQDYRPIGFNRDWGHMGGADATVPQYREMDRMSGNRAVTGYSDSTYAPEFTKRIAEEWTARMENADGTRGPHWTMEQTSQVMKQRGINCDAAEFYAAMNMMYSDYCMEARKFGVDKPEFYADMAKAFLDDKDAGEDKLARYYECIVK